MPVYYKWADVEKDGSPSPLARLASLHVTLPKWQIIGIHLLTGDSSHYLNLFARRVVSLPDKLVESTPPSPPLSFVHERQNYQSPISCSIARTVLGPVHHPYAKLLILPPPCNGFMAVHPTGIRPLPHEASEGWAFLVAC